MWFFAGLFRKYQFRKRWPEVTKKILQEELPRWIKKEKAGTENLYSVDISLGKSHGRRPPYNREIYWDAPYGIVLLHETVPVACIGFDFGRQNIYIKQIQGVREKQTILSGIRWERLLIEIVIRCGKHFGFKNIRILRAKENFYYFRDYDPDEVYGPKNYIPRNRRLEMRYDVTAERRGFTTGERYHTLELQ